MDDAQRSTAEGRARRRSGYESSRPDVLARISYSAKRVLELGCFTGALSVSIGARQEAHVLGVEYDEAYAATARKRLDRVVTGDAAGFMRERPAEAPFDLLICADILEHLVDPWTVFETAASWLSPGGTAVVSIPNVMYFRGLMRLFKDTRWPRDDEGVFDRTHLRWFGVGDVEDLFQNAGLEIVDMHLNFWMEQRPRRDAAFGAMAHTPARPGPREAVHRHRHTSGRSLIGP